MLLQLLLLTLLMSTAAFAQQPAIDDIVGTWEADDGTVKLDMIKKGDEYQAHLLYGNELMEADKVTLRQDIKNPDPALRTRPLKSIVFIWGLKRDGDAWSDGSLYDASSGRTYHCKIQLKSGKMLLRGYLGVPALGQTRMFHRMQT